MRLRDSLTGAEQRETWQQPWGRRVTSRRRQHREKKKNTYIYHIYTLYIDAFEELNFLLRPMYLQASRLPPTSRALNILGPKFPYSEQQAHENRHGLNPP